MRELTHQKDTNSYMQMCLQMEGKAKIYLMVPTYWNEVTKKWMSFVKTPLKGKIIMAEGGDSVELQNNFNVQLNLSFQSEPEETFGMFKPLEYWESRLS